jgi:hypothetical protein
MDKNQDPGSGINIPDPQHCLVIWIKKIELSLSVVALTLYSLLLSFYGPKLKTKISAFADLFFA